MIQGLGGLNCWVQNQLDLNNKMNGLEGNSILRIDIARGLQKMGIILENKVPQNLKLPKDAKS